MLLFDIHTYENKDGRIIKIDRKRVQASSLEEATRFLADSGFIALDPPILGIEYYRNAKGEELGVSVTKVEMENFPRVDNVEFKKIRSLDPKALEVRKK